MYLEKVTNALKENGSYRIVFLGDSITSAEWVHPNWREIVEYVLKEEMSAKLEDWKLSSWGIRCINSGFDGSTTKDWLNLLDSGVLAYEPDMVIVMGTVNDMDLGISVEEHVENLKKVLDRVSSMVGDVVYCTDIPADNTPHNVSFMKYIDAAKDIFPTGNVLYINLFEEFRDLDLSRFFTFESGGNEAVGIKPGQTDYIHPNQLGNAYIARFILAKVFGINFDPERYMKENNSGKMFPSY